MNIHIRKVLWVCLFLFLSAPVLIEAQEEDILLNISRANESYHEKDYPSAAKIFEDLIAQGQHNGYLYYNLGNTYMRLGKTGHAILNYLHAKTLLPRNENLDANLRYAISQTTDQLHPPQSGFLSGTLFWLETLNLNEHFQFLILFNILFWSVSIGLLYYRKPFWLILKRVALGLLLIALLSTGTKYYLQPGQNSGVILASKADIKSDKGIQDITLFQLHEGAIVSVNEEDEGWVRISLEEDKTGWVPKKSVGF